MPAVAQTVTAPASGPTVTSSAPDKLAVAIYRDPNPNFDEPLDLDWLEGWALITETRTVTVPAGRATIRFEGVAGGIQPESALVTGLPDGVREKNLDADLLSPYSLYARSLNRPVTIRRTLGDRTVEERAIIRSGPDGAAVVETSEGVIAANCRPHSDALIYDAVPAGLSAKPTLSIQTDATEARRVTVTLSYLAWGFDWRANYVATMRPDGRSADLFAWVTLANSDVTSFADAQTMVVAGRINRESTRDDMPDHDSTPLVFRCLSTIVAPEPRPEPRPVVEDSLNRLPQLSANIESREILVTGSRIVRREDLGDLKLFRIPDLTTVASMSQKQVALLDRQHVPVDVVYRTRIVDVSQGVIITLRAQNRKEKGLGLPLPGGHVVLFKPQDGRPLLIGEGKVGDKAEGEEVQIEVGESEQLQTDVDQIDDGKGWESYELTVTNANPFPVAFEGEYQGGRYQKIGHSSARLVRKNGKDVWVTELPANGTVKLRYRLIELDPD